MMTQVHRDYRDVCQEIVAATKNIVRPLPNLHGDDDPGIKSLDRHCKERRRRKAKAARIAQQFFAWRKEHA